MRKIQTTFTGVAGTPWYSNMYFGDTPSAQDCVDHVGEFWVEMNAFMVDEIAWSVSSQVLTIDAATGEITGSTSAQGVNGQGGQTQEMLPTATQLVLKWLTGVYVNGRQAQGKTFIPGLADFCNVDGSVNSAIVTQINTDIALWLAAGPPLLLWSKAAGVSNIVTTPVCWNRFGVLRSRRD